MEFIFFWSIIGAICSALIAGGKGRDRILWAIIGFFLGLISVLIVACLPNLKEQQALPASTPRTAEPTKKCPQCAETVKAEAKICRYCRHTFDEPAPSSVNTMHRRGEGFPTPNLDKMPTRAPDPGTRPDRI